ncbi:unnamed protein product [Effrenium voratum]|nr:unnamed protein product [Effrenium voratum]
MAGLAQLRTLHLERCQLGDAEAKTLAELASRSLQKLEQLDLSVNFITDRGAVALARGLEGHPSLRYLGLPSNFVGHTGFAAIADLVRATPRLVDVNLLLNKPVCLATGRLLAAARRARAANPVEILHELQSLDALLPRSDFRALVLCHLELIVTWIGSGLIRSMLWLMWFISMLMPDALRRAFLERCAEVDAGSPLVAPDDAVAPDIAKYQQDAEIFRRRSHSFRNIFVIEASLRKETWAFFTSLPAEVRSYLDRVQDTCKELRHQGANSFAKQVAEVLGQLGVVCELNRMAGPLELHLVVKAVGDTEIVYECCEADAYCAARQDQRTSPPTVETKLRQKLLQRMGYQLVHMNVWEWNRLSEAQRINYMVKLQSLPA